MEGMEEPTTVLVNSEIVPILGPEGDPSWPTMLQMEVGVAPFTFMADQIRPALPVGR